MWFRTFKVWDDWVYGVSVRVQYKSDWPYWGLDSVQQGERSSASTGSDHSFNTDTSADCTVIGAQNRYLVITHMSPVPIGPIVSPLLNLKQTRTSTKTLRKAP